MDVDLNYDMVSFVDYRWLCYQLHTVLLCEFATIMCKV